MRTYCRNSPQAAARIVALVLIADGHVGPCEEEALEKLEIGRELGLAPGEFAHIVQTVCEDRVIAHPPSTPLSGHLDRRMLDALLAEIDDQALRNRTIRLCFAAASADHYLADGEVATLAVILDAWTPDRCAPVNLQALSLGVQPRAAAMTCNTSA